MQTEMEMNSQNTPYILIVDDLSVNVAILAGIIKEMGYRSLEASNGKEALRIIREILPQLILMDISMPGMTGYELCRLLKNNKVTRDIPVIFISALDSSEERVRGLRAGAADIIGKPFEPMEVNMRVENQLKIYKMQREMEAYSYKLNRLINEQMKRIEAEQKNILYALAKITEERDNSTVNHLSNISYNSRLLAQSLQLGSKYENEITSAFVEKIGVAAMLHDIGKIRIPDEILLKPGSLNHEERNIIKQHTTMGAHILEEIYDNAEKNDFLPMAINIAKYHHERWDGTGYPESLKGTEIPLCARIVGLVDIFDALTGERCYKMGYTMEESLQIISECKGTYFEPEIADVFMRIQKQLKHN